MPGAEKSIDILQLLYAIKESKEELGRNLAVSGYRYRLTQQFRAAWEPECYRQTSSTSATPQRGPALLSLFFLPFRYSEGFLRFRKCWALKWEAEKLRGLRQ